MGLTFAYKEAAYCLSDQARANMQPGVICLEASIARSGGFSSATFRFGKAVPVPTSYAPSTRHEAKAVDAFQETHILAAERNYARISSFKDSENSGYDPWLVNYPRIRVPKYQNTACFPHAGNYLGADRL